MYCRLLVDKQANDATITILAAEISTFTEVLTMTPTWALKFAQYLPYSIGNYCSLCIEREKHAVYVVQGESSDLLKYNVAVSRLVASPAVHSGMSPTHQR